MGGFTDFWENEILDHLFRQAVYSGPDMYIGLFTTSISEAGSGTECTGTSYARVLVSASLWAVAASGQTSNSENVSFATPGSGGWGTAIAFAVFDALTNGNVCAYGDLDVSKTINESDTVLFSVGDLVISLD